jgi:hypothetical protein
MMFRPHKSGLLISPESESVERHDRALSQPRCDRRHPASGGRCEIRGSSCRSQWIPRIGTAHLRYRGPTPISADTHDVRSCSELMKWLPIWSGWSGCSPSCSAIAGCCVPLCRAPRHAGAPAPPRHRLRSNRRRAGADALRSHAHCVQPRGPDAGHIVYNQTRGSTPSRRAARHGDGRLSRPPASSPAPAPTRASGGHQARCDWHHGVQGVHRAGRGALNHPGWRYPRHAPGRPAVRRTRSTGL